MAYPSAETQFIVAKILIPTRVILFSLPDTKIQTSEIQTIPNNPYRLLSCLHRASEGAVVALWSLTAWLLQSYVSWMFLLQNHYTHDLIIQGNHESPQ